MAERYSYTLANGQPIECAFKLDDVPSVALKLDHCTVACEACWELLHLQKCGPGDLLRPDGIRGHARETLERFIRAGRGK